MTQLLTSRVQLDEIQRTSLRSASQTHSQAWLRDERQHNVVLLSHTLY